MATKQLEIVIALGVTFSLATCAFGLRLPARRITKVALWWDDYCCMGGYLFATAWGVLILLWVSNGLGRHIDTVRDPEDVALRTAKLFNFFLQLAFTYSITLIKFAILAFYWRVFMQAFWDETITDATCLISDTKYIFWSTLAHFLLDIGIIVLPTLEMRKIQQFSTKQKIGTCSLFGFGIFILRVCAASLVVVVLVKDVNSSSKDIPWNMANVMLWATVEVNLSVVSACLPLFRPVFVTVRKNSLRISGTDYGTYMASPGRGGVSVLKYGNETPAQPATTRGKLLS
ncbi:hypothetical protein PG994_015062 [Apiospora phragmitis]|uniref:Rhodopsin domain-containing protein n=1 Tax=Apiospora phragmitis TaxID=2905665 RepID=A0ABR1SVE4_9PEZI